MNKSTSHRREFLKGRAAQKALQNQISATPPTGSPNPSAKSNTYLLHITRKAMACDFQVFLNAGEHDNATEATVEALDLVEEIEDILSIYRSHSSASQLNQLGARQPVMVHPTLYQLLQQSKELWKATNGASTLPPLHFPNSGGSIKKTTAYHPKTKSSPHSSKSVRNI